MTLLLMTPQQVGERLIGRRTIPFPPHMLPVIALSLIALLSAGWLVCSCILKKKGMNESTFLIDKSKGRVIITLIILFLGVWTINVIGFIASSALVTGLLLVYFGVKNWKTILILTAATSLFIYVFFEVFMKIPLPEGSIFAGKG